MSIAAVTIITKNYLAYARVLAESLRTASPGVPLFALLSDEVDEFFEPKGETFQLLSLASLRIPRLRSFCFRHTHRELLSALKPYVLSYLLDSGFSSVAYFDADILVLSDLTPLMDRIARHALTVTPHITRPVGTEDAIRKELDLLRSGMFNAGFVGVSDRGATRRFLSWWQARVAEQCVGAISAGTFYDQKWLDFAPSFIEDIDRVRDSVYNLAYWNLSQRELLLDGATVLVDGRPCGFFHFSGFDPRHPEQITRYWPSDCRFRSEPAAELYQHYAALLRAAGSDVSLNWPFAYASFDNGLPIPDLARRAYRRLAGEGRDFGDPFQTSAPTSFYRWLTSAVDYYQDPRQNVTRLWQLVYEERPDVRLAYPDWLSDDREAFLMWARQYGIAEHGIAPALLPGRSVHRLRFTGTCDESEFRRRCAEQEFWYHSFYFDNGFEQRGDYNIGLDIEEYGFPADMSGMTVLDVGTGSGWFAAYFEQLGADVTTVDVRGYCDFDLVGRLEYPDVETEKPVPDRILPNGEAIYYSPVSKGFWIMREILGLNARYVNSRVYDIHSAFKDRKFDLVFAGAVLMHLRDPIGGLMSLRRVCGKRLIANSFLSEREPETSLMERIEGQQASWWKPNKRCLTGWFTEAGFSHVDASRYVRLTVDQPFIDEKHSIAANQTLVLVDAYV